MHNIEYYAYIDLTEFPRKYRSTVFFFFVFFFVFFVFLLFFFTYLKSEASEKRLI